MVQQQVEKQLEQKEFLKKLKNSLPQPSAKIRLIRSIEGIGFEDLDHFAKPPGYDLSCRLKQHLDPDGIYDASYYGMQSSF